jgi:acetyl esterase/lipase
VGESEVGARPAPVGDPARSRRRLRTRTRVIAFLLVLVGALIATPFVVNELTPRPLAAVLRALNGSVTSSVQLGPYADRVDDVAASAPIRIPVDDAPDAELTVYRPAAGADEARPVVLLVHGGGWILGSAGQVADYARLLASEGFVVANLGYSLAPEHPYPTPIRQAAAALEYLHAHAAELGGDPAELFVAGNSAGAQIVSQIGAMVADSDLARETGVDIAVPAADLRGVILYSGPYDFDTMEATRFPGFRTFAWAYLGRKDYENAARLDELSTVRTATADYPATYLTTGDADPLEPQTYELDAVLRALGVDVTSRYWTGSGLGLPHDYVYDLETDAARTAFADTVAFLHAHAG